MTVLTATPANISASEERGAMMNRFVTAESLSVGDFVYLNASNKVAKAKADSSAHAQAIGCVVWGDNFYGEKTIQAGGTATVCVFGKVYGWKASNTLVSGQALWVDKTTAGKIADAAPTGGAYQYQVGHALGDDTIFVDPGTTSPSSSV